MVRPRYQSFNNVQQGMSNFQQGYQGFQNPQQQVVQNPQQGAQQYLQSTQQGNQPRKIQVSMFPCPLGCQHSVPWGSLSGCDNFKSMAPQMRKDTIDKLKATKCCNCNPRGRL